MNRFSRIFKYLGDYTGQIFLSIFSVTMLMPFMELIFNADQNTTGLLKETNNPVVKYIRDFLLENIQKSGSGIEGKLKTLGLICIVIIISIFFKNLFLYLSFYILNPLKNGVVNSLRSDLYNKILHLPIGYFTEKRKGDLISRITNDISEVESSIVGALEGLIRDPLTIIINFAA
jgi:subfamily B ATP-binding cassette protein MsbA